MALVRSGRSPARALACAAGLAVGVLSAQPALAQQPPPGLPGRMPTREEIQARIRQVLEASPQETVEIAGVCRIVYKKIPTDPRRVAEVLGRELGGGQLPPGVDLDQYARMYQPMIQELLNEALQEMGTFTALQDLKCRSKRIATGEYRLALTFEGERPLAFVLSREGLRRPIELALRTRPMDPAPELLLQLHAPQDDDAPEGTEAAAPTDEFEMRLFFMRSEARTRHEIELDD